MKDIMIDIETLGTRSTSAIVQIGACYFDRKTGEIGEEFSMNSNCGGRLSFTTDDSTLEWWKEQSKEAKKSVFGDPVHEIEDVLEALSKFLKKGKYLWSHATFDIPIICHAYDVCGMKMPIHYRSMRDIRTLMDLADHTSEIVREGIHHNALDDAKYQAQYCAEAMQKLLGKKHIGL
jgi:hypothetical protein